MLIEKIMRLITKKKKDFPSRWGEIKIYCNAGCYSASVTDLWNGNCKDKQGEKNQYLYFSSQANEAAAPVMLHTVIQALDAPPGLSKDKAAFKLLSSSSTIILSLFHHYSFFMFTLRTTKRILLIYKNTPSEHFQLNSGFLYFNSLLSLSFSIWTKGWMIVCERG